MATAGDRAAVEQEPDRLRLASLLTREELAELFTFCDDCLLHEREEQLHGAMVTLGERLGFEFKDGKAIVSFTHIGGGLMAKGAKLEGFAIAGADRKFVHAQAAIDGQTVVVSSPQVPQPVAVRFGWARYPVVNLWNKDGLPASPFRTDDLPMITAGK